MYVSKVVSALIILSPSILSRYYSVLSLKLYDSWKNIIHERTLCPNSISESDVWTQYMKNVLFYCIWNVESKLHCAVCFIIYLLAFHQNITTGALRVKLVVFRNLPLEEIICQIYDQVQVEDKFHLRCICDNINRIWN